MNNDEKIISMLETLTTTVTRMQGDISDLKTDVKEVKHRVTKIEATLENETNRNINLLVEGHAGIVEKLDGLPEKFIALQDDSQIHGAAITELSKRTANL